MRELIEFRIPEDYAAKWLDPNEGTRISALVRKYELSTGDPRLERIAEADRALKKEGHAFFTAWEIRRRYTEGELASAALFRLTVTSIFEPAGEECGTRYDESTACPICGAGGRQVSDLSIPTSRIPKGKDISRTIAGEIVVSRRFVDLFERTSLTGAEFCPVRNSATATISEQWFQLRIQKNDVETPPPTRFGDSPLDENSDEDNVEGRCPAGDVLGLNLISVLTARIDGQEVDIRSSKKFIGARRGLLRPARIVLISPRLAELIRVHKISGCELEVARTEPPLSAGLQTA
jgi:hypothetical protein